MSDKNLKIISISEKNYLSAIWISKIRLTKRGRSGTDTGNYSKKDRIGDLSIASAKDDVLFLFTNVGKVYKLKLDEEFSAISDTASWPANPIDVVSEFKTENFQFDRDEKVVKLLSCKTSELKNNLYLFMATSKGMLKKIELSELSNVNKIGKKVISLFKGDSLIKAIKIMPKDEILLGLSSGYAVRFRSDSIRASGRASAGVKSGEIDLKSEVKIVSLSSTSKPKKALVLSVDELGKGKCTNLQEFRLTSRRSRGTLAYKLGKSGNARIKKGSNNLSLVSCEIVHDHEELILLSDKNRMSRIEVNEVTKRRGRNTAGTILVKLQDSGEKISHVVVYDAGKD